jgi:tRNA(fMet)-specific endonuclease VapC
VKSLLDTDIVSELMRGKNVRLIARADAYAATQGPLAISAMTVFEIGQGLHQMDRLKQAQSFVRWIDSWDVFPLTRETMTLAGEIGGRMLRAGRTIGVSDTCIAATAIEHGRVLVTGNTRHFEYVREAGFPLELDNWREPAPP